MDRFRLRLVLEAIYQGHLLYQKDTNMCVWRVRLPFEGLALFSGTPESASARKGHKETNRNACRVVSSTDLSQRQEGMDGRNHLKPPKVAFFFPCGVGRCFLSLESLLPFWFLVAVAHRAVGPLGRWAKERAKEAAAGLEGGEATAAPRTGRGAGVRGSHAVGMPLWQSRCGYGSKFNHQGTTGFGLCFHLPGFHVGCLLLTHSHADSRPFGLLSLRDESGLDVLEAEGKARSPVSLVEHLYMDCTGFSLIVIICQSRLYVQGHASSWAPLSFFGLAFGFVAALECENHVTGINFPACKQQRGKGATLAEMFDLAEDRVCADEGNCKQE